MSNDAQTAVKTLVSIAEDTNADPDTRVRAACAILDLEKFQQANAPA